MWTTTVLFVTAAVSWASESGPAHWGYDVTDGPAHWTGTCATGKKQSPIDLRPSEVVYSPLGKLSFTNYENAGTLSVSNNGHTLVVSGFESWPAVPQLSNGGLKSRYRLSQFHLHWGTNDHVGSEHTVSGAHYPAEIHLVHIKEGLTLDQASNIGDGLAVLGIFLQSGAESPISYVDKIISKVNAPAGSPSGSAAGSSESVEIPETEIEYEGQLLANGTIGGIVPLPLPPHDALEPGNETILSGFRPRNLLPSNTDSFYHYEGSLTTPGCNEAVQWYVLADPVNITNNQLKELRSLKQTSGQDLTHNFRPTQPLNNRKVFFRSNNLDKAFRALQCKAGAGLLPTFGLFFVARCIKTWFNF